MTSQQAILALRARGYSDASIGRHIGRDSSLVSQIAVGKKPGRNLAPALTILARSEAPAPARGQGPAIRIPAPPRRAQRLRAALIRQTPSGRRQATFSVLQQNALRRFLQVAAKRGRLVSVILDFLHLQSYSRQTSRQRGSVALFDHGTRAWHLLPDGGSSMFGHITRLANDKPGVEAAKGLQTVTVTEL